jgi:hypothetical protein
MCLTLNVLAGSTTFSGRLFHPSNIESTKNEIKFKKNGVNIFILD